MQWDGGERVDRSCSLVGEVSGLDAVGKVRQQTSMRLQRQPAATGEVEAGLGSA